MNHWKSICRIDDIPVLGARRVARENACAVAIFRNAEAQKRIVDDLLDISAFVKGQMRMEFSRLNIAEVMDLSVAEAHGFFAEGDAKTPAAATILGRMAEVGLGYVKLGQPLSTLSGGERQRLKLAVQMADDATVYVLDEPTSGLHLADVDQLLTMLDRLVDAGKSVIVIEHHQAVMAHADWIIDLGPGAGHDGGQIVFTGTPAELVAAKSTLTGQHLSEYVN